MIHPPRKNAREKTMRRDKGRINPSIK